MQDSTKTPILWWLSLENKTYLREKNPMTYLHKLLTNKFVCVGSPVTKFFMV